VLRHASRGYIFSAALPPAQAAAALTALDVIEREPWRVSALQANGERFRRELSDGGFDILQSQTAVVPIVCGSDERAYAMTRACQERGIFALPVISPAVPANLARIRATVTAAHTDDEIAAGLDVFRDAGAELGLIRSMA
jgi:glycine C-acetyltransferase